MSAQAGLHPLFDWHQQIGRRCEREKANANGKEWEKDGVSQDSASVVKAQVH
jgi:hypothetical protein